MQLLRVEVYKVRPKYCMNYFKVAAPFKSRMYEWVSLENMERLVMQL